MDGQVDDSRNWCQSGLVRPDSWRDQRRVSAVIERRLLRYGRSSMTLDAVELQNGKAIVVHLSDATNTLYREVIDARTGCVTEMHIAKVIYRPFKPHGASKDYEFSRGTMNARWEQGMSDASTTLCAAPRLSPKPREVGVRVFEVMHDILVGKILE